MAYKLNTRFFTRKDLLRLMFLHDSLIQNVFTHWTSKFKKFTHTCAKYNLTFEIDYIATVLSSSQQTTVVMHLTDGENSFSCIL